MQDLEISFINYLRENVNEQRAIMGFDEAFQQGREEGREEGADNNLREVIGKMTQKGYSEEKICYYLDLTPEKVRELRES